MIDLKPYWLDKGSITGRVTDQLLTADDFKYYDKDGFELCAAEHAFYTANTIRLNSCLNHSCCQQDWLDIQSNKVSVDHALLLHRFDYTGDAREQLTEIAETIPQAKWLLQTTKKWGFDLAIDGQSHDGWMFEVVHIEYDSIDLDHFKEKLQLTREHIERIDWEKAAAQVWLHRDSWMHLKGFHRNHWKAKYLFGWDKAEYTEKTA